MTKKIKISVGIVSYDNPTYLDLLFRGLKRNTVNSFEVLVHCNCPSAAFYKVMDKYADIIAYYQTSPENRYISAPYNEIFTHASGQYYLRIDDDMYPPPRWDTAMLAAIDPQNIYRLISPMRYSYRGRHNHNHDFGKTPETFEEDRFNAEWAMHRKLTKNIRGGNGCLFMSKLFWEAMGGYSLKFPRKHDAEFNVRAWSKVKEKIDPVLVADASFYHFGGIGNFKARYNGPDNNHMVMLTKIYGKEMLDEYYAFMKRIVNEDAI